MVRMRKELTRLKKKRIIFLYKPFQINFLTNFIDVYLIIWNYSLMNYPNQFV